MKDESAFPIVVNDNIYTQDRGLTKRELFAGVALQGILASGRVDIVDGGWEPLAVSYADALIKELEKKS